MTVACEKSVLKRSAFSKCRLPVMPSFAALRFDSSTMSGLYSMPRRARAALRRGDHRAAVAGAEIDHVVLRRHFRHVEHLVDERLRRRHPDDVLAGLADLGSKVVPDWVVCAIEHALAAMMSDASAASRTYLNAVIRFS